MIPTFHSCSLRPLLPPASAWSWPWAWSCSAGSRWRKKIERRIGLEEAAAGEVPAEILARDASGWFDRYFYQLLAESGLSIFALWPSCR